MIDVANSAVSARPLGSSRYSICNRRQTLPAHSVLPKDHSSILGPKLRSLSPEIDISCRLRWSALTKLQLLTDIATNFTDTTGSYDMFPNCVSILGKSLIGVSSFRHPHRWYIF